MANAADHERFVALLTSHQPRLMLYVRAMVPNRADADEIIQEVNLYLWRNLEQLRSEESFEAWIRQTARYQVLTYRKRIGRERARFSETTIDQLATAFEGMLDDTDHRQVALSACLQKLSEKDRRLIVCRYEAGATTQSIAVRLGRSAKGIYESLSRIRGQLFECVRRTLSIEEGR